MNFTVYKLPKHNLSSISCKHHDSGIWIFFNYPIIVSFWVRNYRNKLNKKNTWNAYHCSFQFSNNVQWWSFHWFAGETDGGRNQFRWWRGEWWETISLMEAEGGANFADGEERSKFQWRGEERLTANWRGEEEIKVHFCEVERFEADNIWTADLKLDGRFRWWDTLDDWKRKNGL